MADGAAEALQLGVYSVLDAAEEGRDPADGLRGRLEFGQGQCVYAAAFLLERLQEGYGVNVSRGGEILLEHQHQAHLVGEAEAPADYLGVRGELLSGHLLRGIVRQTAVGYDLPDPVETKLAFQSYVCLNAHSLISFAPCRMSFNSLIVATVRIWPARTTDTLPVSSETTIMSASHSSDIPTAALCRIP